MWTSTAIRLFNAAAFISASIILTPGFAMAQGQRLTDTHIHYSHDAWDRLPPAEAIRVLRAAGLERAFVSSSSDEGTQKLYALAPDLIVPVLRPYRKRGELSTWMHDETVPAMLEDLLAKNRYAGIGEFHVFGADADLPVLRRVVELADRYGIFLHAHSDAEAIERLFAQDPDVRIVWAHSGFIGPNKIRELLERYDNLLADLAFRGEFAQGGKLNATWRQLFLDFPDRFMIGTDTYTPERWYAVEDNAAFTREWLSDLPDDVAARIGRDNADELAELTLANWATNAAVARERTGPCAEAEKAFQITSDRHSVRLSISPGDIAVGETFSFTLDVCAGDASPFDGDISVDASMPAHGHGMNNAAVVRRQEPGRYRAEGMMFHMPGAWRLVLQLVEKGGVQTEDLTYDIRIE